MLALAVLVHVHLTRRWLGYAGAPTDLRRRVVLLARTLAHRHSELPIVGMATPWPRASPGIPPAPPPPMDTAADMADHFGEYPDDPLGFAFGPLNVGFRQMDLALERD